MTTRKPAKKTTKKKAPTPVEATGHTDATRTNIPTDHPPDHSSEDPPQNETPSRTPPVPMPKTNRKAPSR